MGVEPSATSVSVGSDGTGGATLPMMATLDVIPVNDLRRAWIATSPDVREAVARVIERGQYVQGPEHDAFEADLASFLGVRHVAAVANGTDALVLAMLAVGCSDGSEVVTAANAGGYAAAAAAQGGARVVYADVDSLSLVVTAETIEAALGPSTRAVVVTHLYGNVADVDAIAGVCRPRGIAIIEDVAQAIGGLRGDRRAGSLADVATFSFYPTKNLGAAGDGGAVATDDPAIDAAVRSLRQYGWAARYVVERPGGRNSRLDELQAAILRIGLREVDGLNDRRRQIVERYRQATHGTDWRLVTGTSVPTVAHLAVMRVPERDVVRATLAANGIRTDIHYPIPDHRQTGLASPSRTTALPVTDTAASEIVTLPCFPGMAPDEVDRVCDLLSARR